jgi:hypothetical protein
MRSMNGKPSRRRVNVRATAGLAGGGTWAYSVGVVSAVEWMPVESGLFSSAAYRANVGQLYLRFQDGKIYRFFDCPLAVYNEFVASSSKGRYFSQQIRNRFRYEMVRRGSSGNRGCVSPQSSLAEQLKASVLLAKARAVQDRDVFQASPTAEV